MSSQDVVQSRRGLLVGLLTGVLAVAFEGIAVATAMPAAAEALGQVGLYGWVFTLFMLGLVLSTVLAGRMADAIGPVRPLAVGFVAFAAGLVLAGSASSMAMLMAARFLQGFGGGAISLCLMVVIGQVFAERERAGIMTAFSLCWLLPAFVGPPVAAWLVRVLSWHWVFFSVLPVVAFAAALSARPLLELESQRQRSRMQANSGPDGHLAPVPVWAAVVAALGAVGVQFAGQELDLTGLVIGGLAVVALGLSLPRLMPPGVLRMAVGLPSVVAVRAFQAGAFFAAESFLPLSLVRQRDFSLFRAGLALTIGSIGWTIGSWLQARSWWRIRRDQIISVGISATTIGVAIILVSARWPSTPVALPVFGWVLAGFGMGLGIASTSLAVMSLSAANELGRHTSSLQVADGLGNALVAGVAGSIFHGLQDVAEPAVTFSWVFSAAVIAGLLGVLSARRIGPVRNGVSGV